MNSPNGGDLRDRADPCPSVRGRADHVHVFRAPSARGHVYPFRAHNAHAVTEDSRNTRTISKENFFMVNPLFLFYQAFVNQLL